MTRRMVAVTRYRADDGSTIEREWGDVVALGERKQFNGEWVLRGPDRQIIDWNKYMNSLLDTYDLEISE